MRDKFPDARREGLSDGYYGFDNTTRLIGPEREVYLAAHAEGKRKGDAVDRETRAYWRSL